MKDLNSKNFGPAASGSSILDTMMKILQQDVFVWESVNKNCRLNLERIALLNEIILEMNGEKTEKLKEMIYLYGSTLEEQDLIERQMFLCMFSMLEENMGRAQYFK